MPGIKQCKRLMLICFFSRVHPIYWCFFRFRLAKTYVFFFGVFVVFVFPSSYICLSLRISVFVLVFLPCLRIYSLCSYSSLVFPLSWYLNLRIFPSVLAFCFFSVSLCAYYVSLSSHFISLSSIFFALSSYLCSCPCFFLFVFLFVCSCFAGCLRVSGQTKSPWCFLWSDVFHH